MVEEKGGNDKVRWGTWEELILGGAVLRHGSQAWDSVANEVRTRTSDPYLFSPQVCQTKYEALLERYSGCSAWFEELRNRRVQELRKALEMSDDSIGSLQSKLISLKAETGGCNYASYNCTSVSPLMYFRSGWNESSGKEASRDGSSAGSFTHETGTTWSKQSEAEENDKKPVVVSEPSRLEKFPSIDELADTMLSEHGVSIKRRRGKRKRKDPSEASVGEKVFVSHMKDKLINCFDGSSRATCVVDRNTNIGVRKIKDELKMKSGSVLIVSSSEQGRATSIWGTNGLKKRRKESTKNGKEGKVEENNIISSDDIMRMSLGKTKLASGSGHSLKVADANDVNPRTSKLGSDDVTTILDSIMESEHASVFRRRLDSQKRARYRSIVRQHMDLDTIRSRITKRSIKSVVELFRDLLLVANNALVFYSRITREYKCALILRDLVTKKLHQHYKPVDNKNVVVAQTLKSPVHKPPAKPRSAGPFNRKPVNKKEVSYGKNDICIRKEGKHVSCNVGSPSSAESSALNKKGQGCRGKAGRVKRANTGIQAETSMKVRKKAKDKVENT